MAEIVVTDEAVEKALDVAMDDGHNGLDCRPERNFEDTIRAGLEAAAPLLQVQAGGEEQATAVLALLSPEETKCPGCGGEITPRYADKGVCSDCYGTTDDPLSTSSNAAALE